MPRVANQRVAANTPRMQGNDLTLPRHAQGVGGEAHRHRFSGPDGGDTIAIAVDPDQAGAGHPQGLLDVPLERRRDRAQQRLLVGKTVGNGPGQLGGVSTPRQFLAAGR